MKRPRRSSWGRRGSADEGRGGGRTLADGGSGSGSQAAQASPHQHGRAEAADGKRAGQEVVQYVHEEVSEMVREAQVFAAEEEEASRKQGERWEVIAGEFTRI